MVARGEVCRGRGCHGRCRRAYHAHLARAGGSAKETETRPARDEFSNPGVAGIAAHSDGIGCELSGCGECAGGFKSVAGCGNGCGCQSDFAAYSMSSGDPEI